MVYQNNIKHSVAVDCVVFGYEHEMLNVLLFERDVEPSKGQISLIGGWVNDTESVEDAASNVLTRITGLSEIFLEQVAVFSKPGRDPGGRVISIVFYALINLEHHHQELIKSYGAKWYPVNKIPELIFDHNEMVQKALEKLQQKASYDLVGQDLLGEQFTLTQLRNLYSSIFQRDFDPGNFRKKVLSLKVLEKMDVKDSSESKKGAFYYRFKPDNATNKNDRIIKK